MADLFNNFSSSSPDAPVPNPKSVHIEVPARGASSQDASTLTSTLPPQVTPIQEPGKQQAMAGKMSGLTLSNLSDQMSAHPYMEVNLGTSKVPPDEQHSPPIEESAGVTV